MKIRFFLKIIFYLLFLRNGIKVDSSYTTSGHDSSNTYSFLASTEDNNAKFRCESKNELSTEPLTAEIVLSVQCEYSFPGFPLGDLKSFVLITLSPSRKENKAHVGMVILCLALPVTFMEIWISSKFYSY